MSATGDGVLGKLLFGLTMLVAMVCFIWIIRQRYRALRLLGPEVRWDQPGLRLWLTIKYAFGQLRLFQYPLSGLGHALIFWGFLVISLHTITLFGKGFSPEFHLPLFGSDQVLGKAYKLCKEVFVLLVLLAVTAAYIRRRFFKPERMTLSFEANMVLGIIAMLMITDFLIDGAELIHAAGSRAALESMVTFSPFSGIVAGWLAGLSPAALAWTHGVSFWAHCLGILFFLNLLPLSKHFHVITAIPNVFFQRLDGHKLPHMPDLEDRLEQMETDESVALGLARPANLSWKQLFDGYTCTECGRCTDNCPASQTGKSLSPKQIQILIRDHFKKVAPILPRGAKEANGDPLAADMAGDVIPESYVWECTTCRACEIECPVSNEFLPTIVGMRRHQVQMLSEFPSELTMVFKGLETNANPWNMGANKRADWISGLDFDVPIMSEKREAKYLYFVGCAASFDDRNQKIAKTFLRLLNKAGVDYAVLGPEETCNGDPARRAGNEFVFQMLAQQLVETLEQYEFEAIVTACPHCLNTLGHEYRDLGANYQVLHSSELLASLVADGKLAPTEPVAAKAVFHDSCYLGRYHGIYDAPRKLIDAIPGLTRLEVEQSGKRGLCCGAGGARYFVEEDKDQRVNLRRIHQLLGGEPAIVASACPFCMTMLDDGIKDLNKEEEVTALDLIEVLGKSVL